MRTLASLTLFFGLTTSAAAQNVAPTSVYWYHGDGGLAPPDNAFRNFIQGSQIGGTFTASTVWPADLSTHRVMMLARLGVPGGLSDDKLDDIEEYVEEGGILVIIGQPFLDSGQTHYDTTNALFDSLDLGLTLQSEPAFPVDCEQTNTVTANPFVSQTAPVSIDRAGDLVTDADSTTEIVSTASFLVGTNQFQLRVAAFNGSIFAVSSVRLFTNTGSCAIGGKEALWAALYDHYCDRDQDGALAAVCGGFDCEDLDPDVGNTFHWADDDGDGFGQPGANRPCDTSLPTNNNDCDDTDPDINPDADEVCDGIDNNCNGTADGPDAVDAVSWYVDLDGDGYGRNSASPPRACAPPSADHVEQDGDCDDGDDGIHPGATEICNNGIDEDCSGVADDPEACPTVVPPPGPGPTTPDPGGCGCSSPASPGALAWLLPALGLLGARRRRTG